MFLFILVATNSGGGLPAVNPTVISAGVSALVAIVVANLTLKWRRNDELREKLCLFVPLLDRDLFHAALKREDPVEMYRSIRSVRHELQTQGARYLRDPKASAAFDMIWLALYRMEVGVDASFPMVRILARRAGNGTVDSWKVRDKMGADNYKAAIDEMMKLRDEVGPHRDALRQRLDELK